MPLFYCLVYVLLQLGMDAPLFLATRVLLVLVQPGI